MNKSNIVSHPAFQREPVLNAPRRGPTPKTVSSLRHYRNQQSAMAPLQPQAETWEQRAKKLERKLDTISWHLLQAAKVMAEK